MPLHCLLLCRDSEVQHRFRRALDHLGIEAVVSTQWDDASDMLGQRGFNALIIDFDEPGAIDILRRMTRPSEGKIVVVALLRNASGVKQAFALGANLVLFKPLTQEQVTHNLRAAKSLMHPTSPREFRARMHTPAYISFDDIHEAEAVILDLSAGGMAIRMLEPADERRKVRVRFNLPGNKNFIEVNGEFTWANSKGQAGIRFVRLPKNSEQQLRQWLSSTGGPKARQS